MGILGLEACLNAYIFVQWNSGNQHRTASANKKV